MVVGTARGVDGVVVCRPGYPARRCGDRVVGVHGCSVQVLRGGGPRRHSGAADDGTAQRQLYAPAKRAGQNRLLCRPGREPEFAKPLDVKRR